MILLLLFLFAAPPQASQQFDAYVKQVDSKAAPTGGAAIDVPHGIIHDWSESVFVPNKRPEDVIAVLKNYSEYARLYPEVTESRVLANEGDRFRVYLKLKKTKVLTVVLDSEYEVNYQKRDDGSWRVVSRSTRIQEEGGGDHGFLWRLNSYWTIAPEQGGVRVQCRAVSLTRDVPAGLGWAVRPIIRDMPRESLNKTLEATRQAVR